MEQENRRDDALFQALDRSKKQRKRRRVLRVLVILLVVGGLLFVLIRNLQKQVEERTSRMEQQVKSYAASYGTISTVVSGTGAIRDVDTLAVTLPQGVEIAELKVEENDRVRKGDLLATLELASVVRAMSAAQSGIQELDAKLGETANDAVSEVLRSGVTGRVKVIYAAAGDDVAACMLEHGALALLSQDGWMSFTVPDRGYAIGEKLQVRRAEGDLLTARVDAVVGGEATLLTPDDEALPGETVTLLDGEGQPVAEAELAIHNPLAVTGFAGTVDYVRIRVNQRVYSGTALFQLKDTSYSAGYDAILRERQQREKTLLELLQLYQNGAVLAPIDGTVLRVDLKEEESGGTAAAQAGDALSAVTAMTGAGLSAAVPGGETPLLTLSRDEKMEVEISVNEADILALSTGETATLTLSALGDQEFRGEVTEVDRKGSGEAAPSVGSVSMFGISMGSVSTGGAYGATVTFPKAEHMLAGMSADVSIRVDGTENVLMVPTPAVHRTSAIAYVYTAYDEESKTYGGVRTVTLGVSNNEYTEIVSGLSEGETVYYTPETESFPWANWGY